MTKKVYLETLKSVLGRSVSHYLRGLRALRAQVYFIERKI